jgi:hypothetical protein
VAAGALLGATLVAVVLAGLFAYYAVIASAPGSFGASGTVSLTGGARGAAPGAGVTVLATAESGARFQTITGPDGSFSLSGIPTGGLKLQFTLAGYSTAWVYAFVSTLYSSGATGVSVTLTEGQTQNISSFELTPFSDLEQFVAAIGAGVVLLGLVAAVSVYAAVLTTRSDRPAVGVVGGGAGLLAPLALALLALGPPFPWLLAGSGALALLGGFALSVRAVQLAQTGPAAT